GALGNQVSALSIPLGTHIADPLSRLHYTHEAASNQKAMSNAVGARDMADASKIAPAMVSGVATRLYSRLGLANRVSPMFNTVVTNVPGPQVPLYMAGAQMVTSYGIGPVMDSMGLFQGVTSYCGHINITVTACREMMPDPAFYTQCLQESFDEMLDAATAPRKEKKRAKKSNDAEKDRQTSADDSAKDADDLTEINGIGKTLAKKLHKAGVRTFADIAGLTAAEAEALDAKLSLRGRMLRESWIAQAAVLAGDNAPETTHADASSSVH
ncbi:MAG: WS/DGAT domain-containing protein, partial [Pseudomonadota bacterium]